LPKKPHDPTLEANLPMVLQPDPALHEGRVAPLRAAITVLGATLVVILLFYGMTREPGEQQAATATAPAPQTTGQAPAAEPAPQQRQPPPAGDTATGTTNEPGAPGAPPNSRARPPANQPAPARN
jgi:hypothetical protein